TTSTPNTRACPASIGSSVASIRMAVVFPAPFGPSTPKISPWRTSRSIPSTARSWPKFLIRPVASIAAVAVISSLPLAQRSCSGRYGAAASPRQHAGITVLQRGSGGEEGGQPGDAFQLLASASSQVPRRSKLYDRQPREPHD